MLPREPPMRTPLSPTCPAGASLQSCRTMVLHCDGADTISLTQSLKCSAACAPGLLL